MSDPNLRKDPDDARNWFDAGDEGARPAEGVTIMGPDGQQVDFSQLGQTDAPIAVNRSAVIAAPNVSQELLPANPDRVSAYFVADGDLTARESQDSLPAELGGIESLAIEAGQQVYIDTGAAVQVIAAQAGVKIYCIEAVKGA